MRKLLASMVPVVLGLAMGATALAQAQNKAPANTNRNTGQEQTIRGVIADVTDVGEMVINYETGQAMGSEASFITVVGTPVQPGRHHMEHGQGAGHPGGHAAHEPAAHQPHAGQQPGGHAQAHHPGAPQQSTAGRHRENVYILEITDRTTFHDAAAGQENTTGTAASQPGFEALEVGDHVAVTFIGREMPASKAKGAKGARPGQGKTSASGTHQPGASNQPSTKHGRERIFYGEALSVTLLPTHSQHHHGGGANQHHHGGGANQHHSGGTR